MEFIQKNSITEVERVMGWLVGVGGGGQRGVFTITYSSPGFCLADAAAILLKMLKFCCYFLY